MPEMTESLPAGFYDQPVLVVDLGRHTSRLWRADVDAAGRLAATASDDRTVRIWSLADGSIVHTIRLPAGPGEIGKARAVAIDPAGELVAAGGCTTPRNEPDVIYVFTAATAALAHRIDGLPDAVSYLTFSQDSRRLAALMQTGGLRVFDRDQGWKEVLRDDAYGEWSMGAAFAPDGRLAATGFDGMIRLYGPDLGLHAKVSAPGGANPLDVAFDPAGGRLAVGYHDGTRVDVLDGNDLTLLYPAAFVGAPNGNLSRVAWAADDTLFAAGRYYQDGVGAVVLAWAQGGQGTQRSLPVGTDAVNTLRALPGGDVFLAASGTTMARLMPDGRSAWTHTPLLANFLLQHETLAVSADGCLIDFDYAVWRSAPARFDLGKLLLAPRSEADNLTAPPRHLGLPIEGWLETASPTLAGRPLAPPGPDLSRSLAIRPDGRGFVLGTEFYLRAFDEQGTLRWQHAAPGAAMAVNVTGDSRMVVAAYHDGTLRWHRLDDGRDILAFMPMADRVNWVTFTPEGFYAASPGGHGMLHWHANAGWHPAKSHAVASMPGFYRPDAIKLVLQELETWRAIGLAVGAEQRRKVQLLTDSRLPPGARLHVLAVGVSRYNDKHASHLQLKFAHQDAHDLTMALSGTQDAIYGQGSCQYLGDSDATAEMIRRALDILRGAMSSKDDLAVFHFAGHGAMIDGKLYLLPHDVNAGDSFSIKGTALPILELKEELISIAERGRVLVLLDACYSGGASLDGRAATVGSRTLTASLAALNVTVLTSSSGAQTSREDPAWRNGALTEAMLEALGGEADGDKDGLIGAAELATYVDRRVRAMTGGAQSPAVEVHSTGTLFAVH